MHLFCLFLCLAVSIVFLPLQQLEQRSDAFCSAVEIHSVWWSLYYVACLLAGCVHAHCLLGLCWRLAAMFLSSIFLNTFGRFWRGRDFFWFCWMLEAKSASIDIRLHVLSLHLFNLHCFCCCSHRSVLAYLMHSVLQSRWWACVMLSGDVCWLCSCILVAGLVWEACCQLSLECFSTCLVKARLQFTNALALARCQS